MFVTIQLCLPEARFLPHVVEPPLNGASERDSCMGPRGGSSWHCLQVHTLYIVTTPCVGFLKRAGEGERGRGEGQGADRERRDKVYTN